MDRLTTTLCDTPDNAYPIVQAGMGRGTVELAAAVCNAGGLGTIGLPATQFSPRARAYGETDEGLVVAGQTATYIDDLPTVEELIESIDREAVETHQAIGAGVV